MTSTPAAPLLRKSIIRVTIHILYFQGYLYDVKGSCSITSGSDSSESNCNDVFPAAAENAAKNLALIDPIEDAP